MSRVSTEELLEQLREGMNQLRARMAVDEVNQQQWMKQWSSLRESLKAQEVEFITMERSQSAAHELFDGMSSKDVIWDREISDALFEERFVPEVIREVANEQVSQDVDFYGGLLQQLPWCEQYSDDVIWDEEPPMCSTPKVFTERPIKDEILDELHIMDQPMSDEMPPMNILWDEEFLDGIDSHDGLLQQVAGGGQLLHEVDQKLDKAAVHEETYHKVVVWDDIPSDTRAHANLLQLVMVVNPVNGEKVTVDESMLLNSLNDHNGPADIEEIESEVHNSSGGVVLQPERQIILEKLKQLSCLWLQVSISSQDCADSSLDQCVPDQTQNNASLSCDPFDARMEGKTFSDECHGNSELLQIIAALTKRTEALEKKLIESGQEVLSLRGVVKASGSKVQQLEYLVDELRFKFDSSLSHLGSMCNSLAKPSIFLIGGYNGVTWLSSLDSFSPEKDILVGLTAMSSPRSYATATALDGLISAIGVLENGVLSVNQANLYKSYKSLLIIRRPLVMILRSVRMSWDPGISTATAWGQAVFRGGINVMAQYNPREAQPIEHHYRSVSPAQAEELLLYKQGQQHWENHRRKSERERERSSSSSCHRDPIPPISSVLAHAPGLISPVQPRVLQPNPSVQHKMSSKCMDSLASSTMC